MTAVSPRSGVEGRPPIAPARNPGLPVLLLAALAGGAIAALSFPPQRVPGAVLVGTAAGLWAMLRARSAWRGAACGFAWGVGLGALLFRWALALDLIAYLGLVPVQAVFWAATGALITVAGRLAGGVPDGWWVLGGTSAWVLVESVRGRWPLGGFEWGQLGWTAADLPLRHAAAVVGTLGVTAIVVALAAGLVGAVTSRGRRWGPLAGSALLAAALAGLGAVGWTSPDGSLDVAVVQIDDPCPEDFAVDCPNLREESLARFLAGTAALEGPFDLLLWGEGTLRAGSPEEAGAHAADAAGGLPAPLLSGVANPGEPGRFHQRNVLFEPDGGVRDVYDKRHPVPFGEYVPWRNVLGGIGDVGRFVPTDLVPGERAVPVRVPHENGSAGLGTVVSWEVTFSRLVRDAGQVGDALATLTTQASYGPGQPVSDQLLGAAQMRSAELQKGMVVAATTGRSALILPDGSLVASTALFAADTMTGELPLRSGSTPFERWGESPVIVLALLAAGAAGAVWWRRAHHRG